MQNEAYKDAPDEIQEEVERKKSIRFCTRVQKFGPGFCSQMVMWYIFQRTKIYGGKIWVAMSLTSKEVYKVFLVLEPVPDVFAQWDQRDSVETGS